MEPVGVQSYDEGEQAGAEQGGCSDDADLQRAESKLQQVERQQEADEPVAKGTQAFGDEQAVDVRRVGQFELG